MKSAALFGLLALFSSGQALAYPNCSLSVSSEDVYVGQSFSFTVNMNHGPLPGPLPPNTPTFTVVFHGAKNGNIDIGPGGETYPALLPFYGGTLPGYGNPGGVAGQYLRYAMIYQGSSLVCVTNSVLVRLA